MTINLNCLESHTHSYWIYDWNIHLRVLACISINIFFPIYGDPLQMHHAPTSTNNTIIKFRASHHNANIYLVVCQCIRRTKQCSATDGCLPILPTVQLHYSCFFQYSQMHQPNWRENDITLYFHVVYIFPLGWNLSLWFGFAIAWLHFTSYMIILGIKWPTIGRIYNYYRYIPKNIHLILVLLYAIHLGDTSLLWILGDFHEHTVAECLGVSLPFTCEIFLICLCKYSTVNSRILLKYIKPRVPKQRFWCCLNWELRKPSVA